MKVIGTFLGKFTNLPVNRPNLVRFSKFLFLQKAYENRHLSKYWMHSCAPCAPASAAPDLHCQWKLGKKTHQSNAKNIKKLHCQCKLGKKTRQTNAKNIKNLHYQCKLGKKNTSNQCKNPALKVILQFTSQKNNKKVS